MVIKNKTSNKKLKTRRKRQINWPGQIKKVIDFCEKKYNFSVFFEKSDSSYTDFQEQEIIVHSGHKPEVAFYALLHEMGHVLVHKQRGQRFYLNGVGFAQTKFGKDSLAKRIGETEEEYEAWKNGYYQAKKMRLYIDRYKWEKIKASWISTYLLYAVERKVKNFLCQREKTKKHQQQQRKKKKNERR